VLNQINTLHIDLYGLEKEHLSITSVA